jgi:hypothetical protein
MPFQPSWSSSAARLRAENSNNPHGFGVLDPNTFTPFPKNPVIGVFFREIHRADELGSGMRNMMRQDLQHAVGLKDDEHFRKYYLLPALEAGLIEMAILDKPRSSKQKYRLTSKGYDLLKKLKYNSQKL